MARGAAHSVRIIGGRWRNTRIPVATRDELRPSGDRVRETLFNWLAPWLPGARCLDLFAGTGVLGFEALSRGAAHCTFVERDPRAVTALEALRDRLAADGADIRRADVREHLRGAPTPCDIVFIDPPFHQGLVADVLPRLAAGWLAPGARVYVECERGLAFDTGALTPYREGHTQQVTYRLLEASG